MVLIIFRFKGILSLADSKEHDVDNFIYVWDVYLRATLNLFHTVKIFK